MSNGDGTSRYWMTDEPGDLADGKDESDSKYKVYWNVIEDWAGGADGHDSNGVNTIRVIVKWTERGRNITYKFDMLRNRI